MKMNIFAALSDKCNLKGHLLMTYSIPSRCYYQHLPLISAEVLHHFFVLS